MNIDLPLRELGSVAAGELKEKVLSLPPEAWLVNKQRQQDYDVHRSTESVEMVFTDGEAYEINNQKTHSVMNKGSEPRITFIFDYVPADHVESLS